jgi:hypothetical protein
MSWGLWARCTRRLEREGTGSGRALSGSGDATGVRTTRATRHAPRGRLGTGAADDGRSPALLQGANVSLADREREVPRAAAGILPGASQRASLCPSAPPLAGVAEPRGRLGRGDVLRPRVGPLLERAQQIRLPDGDGQLRIVRQEREETGRIAKREAHGPHHRHQTTTIPGSGANCGACARGVIATAPRKRSAEPPANARHQDTPRRRSGARFARTACRCPALERGPVSSTLRTIADDFRSSPKGP